MIFHVSAFAQTQLMLDSTFNSNGMRIDTNTFTATYPTWYEKMIELPDGSYVGAARQGIHKVLANGQKDVNFGTAGMGRFPSIPGYEFNTGYCIKNMGRQRDGKIVVLAQVKFINKTNPFYCVLRYQSNGKIDSSFNGVGFKIDSLLGHSTEPWNMAIDTISNEQNDIIYITGTYGYCTTTGSGGTYCIIGFYVSALNQNGQYITSFANNGSWTGFGIPYHAGGTDYFTSIHVISKNKILLSGVRLGSPYSYFALKVNQFCTIDSTFGVNGLWEMTDTVGSFSRYAFTKMQSADKLVLYHSYGYMTDSTYIRFIGLDTNGHIMNSFGNNGEITQSLHLKKDLGAFYLNFPLAIDVSGRIYFSTYQKDSSTAYLHIMRLLANGQKDVGFGNQGIQVMQPITNDVCLNGNIVYDLLVTHDQKLVVAWVKDLNQFAMSYGGSIYRLKEKNKPTGISSSLNVNPLILQAYQRQLILQSPTSGTAQLCVYNLQGDIIYATSLYLTADQQQIHFIPNLPQGICMATIYQGIHRTQVKWLHTSN